MQRRRVPTKAEAKFKHEEIIAKMAESKKKASSRKRLKKAKKKLKVFDTSESNKEKNEPETVAKDDTSDGTSKINSEASACNTKIDSGEKTMQLFATDYDTTSSYDTEKLGDELLLELQAKGLNKDGLTDEELQTFVNEFSLKWNLDAAQVNIIWTFYLENKKRLIDGMMTQLIQQNFLKDLETFDAKKLEPPQKHFGEQEEKNKGHDDEEFAKIESKISEDSEYVNEDLTIPLIRPRTPLFEDDLGLANINDQETRSFTKKEELQQIDLFKQDKDGDTYLHIAVVKNHKNVPHLIALMQDETLDIQNKMGHTPLHLAVILKNVEIVHKLIACGSSVAVMDCHGNTPLHLSCQDDDYDLLSCLLTRPVKGLEAAMSTRNYKGEAPIHIAMLKSFKSKNDEIVRLLLDKNCDINIVDGRTGKTCLFMALENKKYEMAELLLNKKADVNIGAYSGTTPLHLAAEIGHVEFVKKLIANNASIHAKTSDLQTAKDVAENKEVKQLLEKAMKKERRNRQKERLKRPRIPNYFND